MLYNLYRKLHKKKKYNNRVEYKLDFEYEKDEFLNYNSEFEHNRLGIAKYLTICEKLDICNLSLWDEGRKYKNIQRSWKKHRETQFKPVKCDKEIYYQDMMHGENYVIET